MTFDEELEKLNDIFENIPVNKKRTVERLIENAAFMAVELEKLQAYIAENGATEEYQNGANQFGKKKSSEMEVYNTMIKNYSSIIKQLIELLPTDDNQSDDLMEFLSKK